MSTAMQTDQCQDHTGDKPPTTEADLETQTGKEESCALEEKNSKLAYSANRGSQEWTVTNSRCFWHYVSNNIKYGGCRSDKCREVVFDQKRYGFQVIPYQNAGAAWNQSLMLNAMVQAIEVMVLSSIDLQLFLSGTDEGPLSSDCLREYLQTQCHQVSSCCPQCKSHGVCHLKNPDKMYKIINVKDFQTCYNNMSVAEPRNQAEVLSKCTSIRTTTFPLIVPGRLVEILANLLFVVFVTCLTVDDYVNSLMK